MKSAKSSSTYRVRSLDRVAHRVIRAPDGSFELATRLLDIEAEGFDDVELSTGWTSLASEAATHERAACASKRAREDDLIARSRPIDFGAL